MRKQHTACNVRRRRLVVAGLATPWAAVLAQAGWRVEALAVPEPIAQLRAAQTVGWLAVGEGGGLWWLRASMPPVKLASGIDARTPVSAAHGRVVARRGDGHLWHTPHLSGALHKA